MKRVIFFVGLLAVVAAIGFAQDADSKLPQLAVMDFSTNINTEKVKADAITVRNLVESQMVGTRKYKIMTRAEIDKLIENQQIQVSNISSDENIRKLKLENVGYIITGSVDAMGDDYAITVRVLDVSTGQFSHSDNDFMGSGSRDLYNGINGLMTKFVAGMSADSSGAIVQGTARSGTGQTYNIGDFGPAGGHIFYDKGVFSNGWRYLEAAPVETEFTAQWGAYQQDVHGTVDTVGFGKRNTEAIVGRLSQLGESGCAAQLCTSLNFDGFADWFLPSKDELDLMYKNLKLKGLGGFGSNSYCSSSQLDYSNVMLRYFGDGYQYYSRKNVTYSVRAVRAF